jgi:SAM-dependent methyltransferase
VLDLGALPLAGDFQPAAGKSRLFPLAIQLCNDCGLLQVRETVPPEALFGPSYSYASGTVPGLVRHFNQYAEDVRPSADSKPQLLEVGCNDGVFLEPLRQVGYRTVGIDASDNVAAMARAKGLDVVTGFFDRTSATSLRADYGPFDVISCSNVFAHNPNISAFMEGVTTALKPQGEFWIEVHSADRLFNELQWDCFYHEHCFYWTMHALERCLRAWGFRLATYLLTPMHGGGIRAFFTRGEGTPAVISEPELTQQDWADFGLKCHRSRRLIRDSVEALGVRYAYGAAGRAVTLINWADLGPFLDFVVDGSPLRFGRYIPNTNVPIISEQEFFEARGPGKWCFVTAHNYLADIRRKVERAFPDSETRYVTPLPDVRIQ